jgi:aspartyl-tRNA(Asn)/glutamyl-tRNA(Gln) amidotransferase subunit C
MPRLTDDEVARVARLAQLDLTPEERERFMTELGAILEYASQLARIDTSSVEPFVHAPIDQLPERPDEQSECLSGDQILGQAPDGDLLSRLFRVPRVLS